MTAVDPTRPTIDYATGQEISDTRVIETAIRYPTLSRSTVPVPGAEPATADGPFPVIVFAHGYAVTPHSYEPLLDSWVRAGFVVVAPIFPVDNYYEWVKQGGGSAPEADIVNEPADVVVAVTRVAQLAAASGSWLHGLVDFTRLGLAGQSDGADVMAALEYDRSPTMGRLRARLPHRVLAVGVFSGAELAAGPGPYAAPRRAPALLFIQSDADECNPTGQATQLYDAVAPRSAVRFFLRLHGADHLGPYQGGEPWFRPVSAVSTDFFEMSLGAAGDATARSVLGAGNVPGVSSVVTAPSVDLPPTADVGACGTPSPNP